MPEFHQRLEQALMMRDMKPADLARKTGIGEGAISQYRKGAYKASQRNLEKISKALCVPIPWLMGASDDLSLPFAGGKGGDGLVAAGRGPQTAGAKESGPAAVSDAEAALDRELLSRLLQLTSAEREVVSSFVQSLLSLRDQNSSDSP